MRTPSRMMVFVLALLALGLGIFALDSGGFSGVAFAQGPRGGTSSSTAVGTGFTYQGQLKQNGALVNSSCDFQFGLWDALAAGPQYGATQTVASLAVTNGLFTTALDFGVAAPNNVFTGTARYLQSVVRCPAGSGSYTSLSPRQALTPAPYAFALPGLYTQQNATSPNVIGGYSGNVITPTLFGATIGGGGQSGFPNRVWANYATVGGGQNNTASNAYATVGGGYGNTASNASATICGGYMNTANSSNATVGGGTLNTATGSEATIGGGYNNTASGNYATVSGGNGNAISASYATVGGGSSNTASGSAVHGTVGGGSGNTASANYATIAGGTGNTASGNSATIAGGSGNTASYFYAMVGGGDHNTASGAFATTGGGDHNSATGYVATVGGGYINTASGSFSTVPGGRQSVASHYGEMAYANGRFAADGDAQTSTYVLRRTTYNNMGTEIFLDGEDASQRLTIAANRTVVFDILVVGRRESNGNSAGYRFVGVIENVGGTSAFVGSVTKTVLAEDDGTWDVDVTADNTNDSLKITVTGPSGTVRWVAVVHTVEVAN